MSLKQQATKGSDVEERLAALITNSNAVRAIAAAVEGTLGPKGLDTMLVDKFGEVVITNDGVTILTSMEANHPAAKMLINIARAQQAEIGDGTTTAIVMAGALVSEGVDQIIKGVPVTRVIEGIRAGVVKALELLREKAVKVKGTDDPVLMQIALIAGREHSDIAELVVQAAAMTENDKMTDRSFKLSDAVKSQEGAENEVFMGIIINKERLNKHMPKEASNVKILVIDDALEPEEIEDEALATEAGFARYQELQEQFKTNLAKS
jgi:chaperonin GroEL (HSP60 family)